VRPLTALAAVAVSAASVRTRAIDGPDRALRAALAALRTPARDEVVRVATDLGSLYGVGVVFGLLEAAGRPRRARRVALAGPTAWTLAQAAKPLLPRGRPYEVDGAERLVVEPSGSSWPSGHAAVASALAHALGQGRGRPTRLALGVVATAVGASRVYVGVHHPSDVLAGHGVGALAARLTGVRR
jgi:membrane-associated phospholipid phosphatase